MLLCFVFVPFLCNNPLGPLFEGSWPRFPQCFVFEMVKCVLILFSFLLTVWEVSLSHISSYSNSLDKLDIPKLVSLTSVGNYNSHDSQTECLLVLLANSWSCIPIISGGNKTGKAAIDFSNIYWTQCHST